MTDLEIMKYPADVLREPATPIGEVTGDIRQLGKDMLAAMYKANGVGLAAPQVGKSVRLFVCDAARGEEASRPLILINPQVTEASKDTVIGEEGCLSIPGVYGDVERPAKVTVAYIDEEGDPQSLEAEGLMAKCIQHEIDHLDGILFPDHLSRLKRQMLYRKYKKLQKEAATEQGKAAVKE